MNVNFDKIDYLRKQKGLSISGLCCLININRTTFWSWKNNVYRPVEKNIRSLAKALNVSVTEISDLEETVSVSSDNLSDSINSWYLLGIRGRKQQNKEFSFINREIFKLEEKLSQATTIINALLKSMQTIFYVKDKNLKYITANISFLKNLNLDEEYNVIGKTDKDFFNSKEAHKNQQEDEHVISTGKPVVKNEGYIPGTRKKKWGIISKYPIYDSESGIAGIVGTFVDITDRKLSEETRKILHILLETGPGFNFSVWKNGKTLFDIADNSMLEFYSEEMKAKRNEQLDYLKNGSRHPEDVERMKIEVENKKIDGSTYRKPFVMTNKVYRFISSKYGTRWVKAMKSGASIGNAIYTIGCTYLYNKEKQKETNSAACNQLLNELSEKTQTITWTIELTSSNELYFTFLSNSFETTTGYPISNFINLNPDLITLREHFQDPHVNEGRQKPLSIIENKYHNLIKKHLTKKNMPKYIKLNIKNADNKLIAIETTISKHEMPGTNIVFYGQAKKI
jgi:PAS domain S-box-containing protein